MMTLGVLLRVDIPFVVPRLQRITTLHILLTCASEVFAQKRANHHFKSFTKQTQTKFHREVQDPIYGSKINKAWKLVQEEVR
jgi:hypothetical protein